MLDFIFLVIKFFYKFTGLPSAYIFAFYTSLEGPGVWLGAAIGGFYVFVGMIR